MLLGALLIVKGWVCIYASEGALVQDGVYDLMRHPQYVGIMLIVLGQLIDWPTFATIILSPFILWLYVRLAYREENVQLAKFGVAYERYRQRVPMFVPHWNALWAFFAQNRR
jgi:protein-S-isoprenylcysteine O-methyltransferase Ste14